MSRLSCATLLLACTFFSGASASEAPRREPEQPLGLQDHLENLATRIGPRQAGSASDRLAQEYVAGRLERLGLEVHRQELGEVRISDRVDVELHSANIFGVRSGSAPGAILVGAHHDSRNASCPGASDDASGVSVVLEAARILSRRPPRHTLIFASFAGEETHGLPGSRKFLEEWKGEPFLFALTLDFVGSGKIFVAPFPRPPELWANRLLSAAVTPADRSWVSFDPWLTVVPRLIDISFAADHGSFLEAGIPALNLSCQFPAWIYHTSEDRAERTTAPTLRAARDVVVRIVDAADARGLPPLERDPGYLPLPLGGRAVFFRSALLRAAAILVGLLAVATLARNSREVLSLSSAGEALRAVLVCLPLALITVSAGFAGGWLISAVRQLRHPGYAHPAAYLGAALAGGILGLWISVSLARFVRPTTAPGAYLAAAILLESVAAGGCLAVGRFDVAFPFLLGTAGMLLAAWCRTPGRRVGFGLLGFAALVPFLSPTTYRMFQELSGVPVPSHALELAVLGLGFPWFLFLQHLSCLPEILGNRFLRGTLRPRIGLTLGGFVLAATILASTRPAYDARHRILVTMRQEIDLDHKRTEVILASSESLREVRLAGREGPPLPDALETRFRVPFPARNPPSLDIRLEESAEGYRVIAVRGSLAGTPRLVSLDLSASHPVDILRGGEWRPATEYRKVIVPDSGTISASIPVRLPEAARINLDLMVESDEDLLGLRPGGPWRVIRAAAVLRARKTLP
jgi:peptidase M28-like protein